ncbi:LAMI_0H17238g1_1 [Lachancea mirantina]|uniref:Nuclear mRNA export factor n=1 Tax=Lachancea mirantina TaxID=1230905 RepID=A0A1G4KJE1_9SACH|nr:LAMI_0H17238g1_1 [Lachancea mirantina]
MSSGPKAGLSSLPFNFFSTVESVGSTPSSRSNNKEKGDQQRNKSRPRSRKNATTRSKENQYGDLNTVPMKDGSAASNNAPHLLRTINVGALVSQSPEHLGFEPLQHQSRPLPSFLIQQIPQLTPRPFVQDPWDRNNQEKMLGLEQTVTDVTELWETFKKMRETERNFMEEKGLVDKAEMAKNLQEAIIFQGTCLDMCPIFERTRRTVENNVVRYEKEDQSSKRASRSKALKVFARPAAAAAPPLPSDVRPPHVLVKTLDYLVDNILNQLPDCEAFLWDRMRSIRQDFTFQNYSGPEAVDCNERIVRIHLLVLHVMAVSNQEYSRQQELEQLHKALITLSEIYDELRNNGKAAPNEAEFRAYSLLSRVRDPEYDKMIQEMPIEIFSNKLVQLAVCFRRIISNSLFSERGHIKTESGLNLYLRFFELLKSEEVPFLMCSFLEVYLNEIRFYGFKSLAHSVNRKHKPIPFAYVIEIFQFNNLDELQNFCEYYSVETNTEGIIITSLAHHSHILPETKPMKQSYLVCVDKKIPNGSIIDLVNGSSRISDGNGLFEPSPLAAVQQQSKKSAELKYPSRVPSVVKRQDDQGKLTRPRNPSNSFAFNISGNNTPDTVASNVEANKQKQNNDETKNALMLPKVQNDDLVVQSKSRERSEIDKKKEREEHIARLRQENHELAEKRRLANQEEEITKSATALLAETVIEKHVKSLVSDVVKQQIAAMDVKTRKINALSSELYESFIHELLYFIHLDCRADIFHSEMISKRLFNAWRMRYIKRKKKHEEKLQSIHELAETGRQLGVPNLKRPRLSSASNSYEGSTFSFPVKSENSIFLTPMQNEESHSKRTIQTNKQVWEPLSLKEIYLMPLISKLTEYSLNAQWVQENCKILNISLYSRKWEAVSSRWLLAKFGLDSKAKRSRISQSDFVLGLDAVGDKDTSDVSEDLQLFVYNSGVTDNDIFDLELKLKQDGERLIELIHGVALKANYVFSLMIVYWESAENPLSIKKIMELLRLNKIAEGFAPVLADIEIVRMSGTSPHAALAKGLTSIANSFTLKLTERGKYKKGTNHRRHTPAVITTRRKFDSAKNIDESLQKALVQDMAKRPAIKDRNDVYARLQSHISASPRMRSRKLSVLLSDSNREKFKTPKRVRSSTERSASESVTSLPSYLAVKARPEAVTGRQLKNPSTFVGTPSHSRYQTDHFPNSTVLHTPSLTSVIGHGSANISGMSNITFDSEVSTSVSEEPGPNPPAEVQMTSLSAAIGNDRLKLETGQPETVPETILELQKLIKSVKTKLQRQ